MCRRIEKVRLEAEKLDHTTCTTIQLLHEDDGNHDDLPLTIIIVTNIVLIIILLSLPYDVFLISTRVFSQKETYLFSVP